MDKAKGSHRVMEELFDKIQSDWALMNEEVERYKGQDQARAIEEIKSFLDSLFHHMVMLEPSA